jgi:death-on-curing protein
MISVCVKRPQVWIRNFIPYPHLLHKATVLLHSVISFHPFVDGNKRIALLATTFYLHWNGYDFEIPYDADKFTIEIAEEKHSLNEILRWIQKNSKITFSSVLNRLACSASMWIGEKLPFLSDEYVLLLMLLFFYPQRPIEFFRKRAKVETKK